MLDIKFIRENPDKVKEGLRKKGVVVDVDRFLELDKKERIETQKWEKLRAEEKRLEKQIYKKYGKQGCKFLGLTMGIRKLEKEAKECKAEMDKMVKTLND